MANTTVGQGLTAYADRMSTVNADLAEVRRQQKEPPPLSPKDLVGQYLLVRNEPGGWISAIYLVAAHSPVLVLRAPLPSRADTLKLLRAFIQEVATDISHHVPGCPPHELWICLG